jgi:hypothetical protein
MARIVVCGYMVRYPVAGNVLAFFHYLLGLHRLGHQVCYLEESGWPNACYDPAGGQWADDPAAGLRIVRTLLDRHRVECPLLYVRRESDRDGREWSEVQAMLSQADLLLNLGGVCWLPEFRLCRRRALVDMDPLFTQLGRFGGEALHEHDAHFSYGANIGLPGCRVPTRGIRWLPTVPPVVADIWHAAPAGGEHGLFTTVAHWTAYGAVRLNGERFGQKEPEFLRFMDLPAHTTQRLELAVSGLSPGVRQELESAGWSIRDAGPVTRDVETLAAYLGRSRGEFSVAKEAYVKTRSGWFSDRSVCYLASGRPVVLQDTGFSRWLETGQGVLAFSTLNEAAECIDSVNRDYGAHCRRAREIAGDTFGHDVVLPPLVEAALGIGSRDDRHLRR